VIFTISGAALAPGMTRKTETGTVWLSHYLCPSLFFKNIKVWFLGSVKGIANLFITPPKVTKLGNTTMLEFGGALLKKTARLLFQKLKISRKTGR
jgi:hypothetical protein